MIETGGRFPGVLAVAIRAGPFELSPVLVAMAVHAGRAQAEVGAAGILAAVADQREVLQQIGPVALPAVQPAMGAFQGPARRRVIESLGAGYILSLIHI